MQLTKFSTYVNLLYPHEVSYLDSIQNFQNEEVLRIFNRIRYNVLHPDQLKPFFLDIDKRKYSNLLKWIQEKLTAADVDVFFEWILVMEKKINTDCLLPEDEKLLLKAIKTINPTSYNFIRFYEMLNSYRDFLLIRTRIFYYKSVQEYLEKYESDHMKAVDLNRKMNNSAVDIIYHHTTSHGDSKQWEDYLMDIFTNKSIDGFSRYKAFVRITYIHYNYRNFERLRGIYDELDKEIQTPNFYSKRILANYYSNRAMMHSMLREMDWAEKYAYMSIRQKNSDFLFYHIKLCNILIIKNKNKDALKLMSQNITELKHENSMYTRIGFVAVYIRVLNKNEKFSSAESYGDTFLSAYKKDIFNFRWHIFFCAYLMSLLKQEKYRKLINLEKRYKLAYREKEFYGKARYIPTILWYQSLARYMEGEIDENQLQTIIYESMLESQYNKYMSMKINELSKELSEFLPHVFLSSDLFKKKYREN